MRKLELVLASLIYGAQADASDGAAGSNVKSVMQGQAGSVGVLRGGEHAKGG